MDSYLALHEMKPYCNRNVISRSHVSLKKLTPFQIKHHFGIEYVKVYNKFYDCN
jgi:hypothetical protein